MNGKVLSIIIITIWLITGCGKSKDISTDLIPPDKDAGTYVRDVFINSDSYGAYSWHYNYTPDKQLSDATRNPPISDYNGFVRHYYNYEGGKLSYVNYTYDRTFQIKQELFLKGIYKDKKLIQINYNTSFNFKLDNYDSINYNNAGKIETIYNISVYYGNKLRRVIV